MRLMLILALSSFAIAVVTLTPDVAEAAPKKAVTLPFDGGLPATTIDPSASYVIQCANPCVLRTFKSTQPLVDAGLTLTVDFQIDVKPKAFEFDGAGDDRIRVLGVDGGNPGATLFLNGVNPR